MGFFKKWEALLALEEQDIGRFRKELWTMGALEREEKGRCLSSMLLDTTFSSADGKGVASKDMRIHQFTYRFVRKPQASQSKNLLHGHILVGDPVTISVEPHLLALSRGYVLDLTPTEVVVGVDHVLSEELVRSRSPDLVLPPGTPIVFRIDKDELAGGMARVRDNLAQLFYVHGDTRRRALVVDLESPTFSEEKDGEFEDCRVAAEGTVLNANQVQAMEHALRARDYALILGMPGTGKTTTIAEIIRVLVKMGKRVLLTSYTHSAVDTILLKLAEHDERMDVLRLGNLDKVCIPLQVVQQWVVNCALCRFTQISTDLHSARVIRRPLSNSSSIRY